MTELTGAEIRRLREACNLDIKDVAPKTGWSVQQFRRIEAGRKGTKRIINVPKGFKKPFRQALLDCLAERKQFVESAESLKDA